MKVLGLSSNYHDASSALVIDGAVAAAAAEERFTLIKHDPSFPHLSAKFCVEQAGIRFDDLDLVAYHEDPQVKFSRTLSSAFAKFPHSRRTFIKSMQEAITAGLWIKNSISRSLDIDPEKIAYVPHHFSHAAHSFLGSPFKDAAILTLDAVGEWTCSGVFAGNGATIEPLDIVPFPHSLGLIYSAFTAFLGFKVNDGECSTMALAAFGQPRYADEVRKIIRTQKDGTYLVDTSYFDFGKWDALPLTDKFVKAFGAPRNYRDKLPFDSMSENQAADIEAQRFADVAASIQLVLEESVLELARYARKATGNERVCLSGGVALNCVANGKLIEAGIFKDHFVPPDPGDGGGAMGAALYASLANTGARNDSFRLHPYFGKAYDESEMMKMLPELDLARIADYSKEPKEKLLSLKHDRIDSEQELIDVVVDALLRGKAVGWMQGRFENGPRALGNRSILLDPSNVEAARKLSVRVKKRAPFRPYACSLCDFEIPRVFGDAVQQALPAKWMQTSHSVSPELRSQLRAAIHIDGSTRPQVCTPEENPRYYRLIEAFGRKKGLAAVLNTSFNESGYPIVSSPNEALMMFLRTEMDILVVNNAVIRKG